MARPGGAGGRLAARRARHGRNAQRSGRRLCPAGGRGDLAGQTRARPDQPWLYAGERRGRGADGGLVTGIDFALSRPMPRSTGLLVDEPGAPLIDVRGWANAVDIKANPACKRARPIEDGTFACWCRPGTYRVSLKLPEGAPWLADRPSEVEAGSGITSEITLTLRAKDAAIAGALWDHQAEEVVTGVKAQVMAFERGDPGCGPRSIRATAPTDWTWLPASGRWATGWTLTRIMWRCATGADYPVASGQTVPAPLPVAEKDGEIAGIVLDPDWGPAGRAQGDGRRAGAQLGDLT